MIEFVESKWEKYMYGNETFLCFCEHNWFWYAMHVRIHTRADL